MKVIAEIVTSPVGEGVSLSKFVKEAIKEIDNYPGIRVLHHPMGTVVEADSVDQVLEVTKLAHEAIFKAGAKRVVTTLKIDDRRDKDRRMEDKVNAVTNTD
ncbi:MAG: thiamine-binding protein [Methanobacteriota archaeon]|nr:MAG: thiamine-binding protein [Euryarchaeota archaeon]